MDLKRLAKKLDEVLESITPEDIIDYFNYEPTPAEQILINDIEVK